MTGFSPLYSDHAFESVLLDEARHRHANEFAAALAALSLVRASGRVEHSLLDKAIERLDGNVRIERLLLNPGTHDVGVAVLDLASLLSSTRVERPVFKIRLVGRGLVVDLGTMRLILLVAYELMTNAMKRSEQARPIAVRVAAKNGTVRLTVVNAIAGTAHQTTNFPSGLPVLRRLAAACGGYVACKKDGDRHVAQAFFPMPERER
ncbi:hypothetical protein K3177_14710 [Qipengyuania sp. GH25]|uniref:Sensor histidine kinase n=1 Tax=Qipengyuania pacifica TaxID=2860199 RepID=A0ABS7JK36_9SPHN|nr:hypothetical protein [Qipengyuania aerophila]MBX7489757.1 hypothetical protein [Qipengyuania aerophila]